MKKVKYCTQREIVKEKESLEIQEMLKGRKWKLEDCDRKNLKIQEMRKEKRRIV